MTAIDFHTHILPKADHGCDSEEMAASQLSLLKNAGVGIAVATPHFYPHRHNITEFTEKINTSLSSLLTISPDKRPKIAVGAEVLICDGIDKMENIEALCIRGTRTMLLEMPLDAVWSKGLFDTVSRLIKKDITVVLAHVDRYLPEHKEDILYLLDIGAYAQINARAFKKLLLKRHLAPFIKSEQLAAFGSDIHGTSESFADAFADLKKLKNSLLDEVTLRSEKLLEGALLF